MARKLRIVRSLRFLFEGAVLGEIADASQFQVPDDGDPVVLDGQPYAVDLVTHKVTTTGEPVTQQMDIALRRL